LAPFGNLSAGGFAAGVGGGETIASRKYTLCKFMIINLCSSKIQSEFEITMRVANGALILKSRTHLRKDRQAFQPARHRIE